VNKVYAVFISRRYSNQNYQLKGIFDNPESATECFDYYNKGLEKQSPYRMVIQEIDLRSEFNV
jgi:hypothetical protein